MPVSRSAPSRTAERNIPTRRWPLILAGLLVLAIAVIFVLPASMMAHFLPAQLHAEDFSGSLLHGAAGKISVNAKDAGAAEWRLHPLSLLRLAVVADIHWVKVAFVLDGTVEIGRDSFEATHITGGGPIDSLRDLGIAAGWQGSATVALDDVRTDLDRVRSAVGNLKVAHLSSASLAEGSDLGNYLLQLAPDGVAEDGTVTATIKDMGGPIQMQAQLTFTPSTRTGLFSGTLRGRPEASAALINQLNSLAQVKPRDAAGKIPVDLEFTL